MSIVATMLVYTIGVLQGGALKGLLSCEGGEFPNSIPKAVSFWQRQRYLSFLRQLSDL